MYDVDDILDEHYPKLLSCELCNYKSNRKSNFDRHMKSMHEQSQQPFQCCGQVFINKASLKSHSKEFHMNGYRCEEQSCNKVFPRKALLRRHQTVHNGIKDYSCPQCVYETSHKSNLERHCSRVHNLIVGNLKSNKKNNIISIISKNCNNSHKNMGFSASTNASENSSQTSSQSSTNSETELNSSQELISRQESEKCIYNGNGIKTIDTSLISDTKHMKAEEQNSVKRELLSNDCLKCDETLDAMKLTDEDLKSDHKKLRLCLRPYKCLICWALFESQLEYFEHQLLTDHMIEDSEQLDVIRAAAVLTQFSRSKNR